MSKYTPELLRTSFIQTHPFPPFTLPILTFFPPPPIIIGPVARSQLWMYSVEDSTVRLGSQSDPLHPNADEATGPSLPYRNWEGQPPPPPPGVIDVTKGAYF